MTRPPKLHQDFMCSKSPSTCQNCWPILAIAWGNSNTSQDIFSHPKFPQVWANPMTFQHLQTCQASPRNSPAAGRPCFHRCPVPLAPSSPRAVAVRRPPPPPVWPAGRRAADPRWQHQGLTTRRRPPPWESMAGGKIYGNLWVVDVCFLQDWFGWVLRNSRCVSVDSGSLWEMWFAENKWVLIRSTINGWLQMEMFIPGDLLESQKKEDVLRTS